MELKTLKTYIKTHLKTGFIEFFKSLVDVFILFNQKSDKNFYFYVNYHDLNNLTIQKSVFSTFNK